MYWLYYNHNKRAAVSSTRPQKEQIASTSKYLQIVDIKPVAVSHIFEVVALVITS